MCSSFNCCSGTVVGASAISEQAYKESVLPAAVTARVTIEMASTFGWERYAGSKGKIIGMRTFGASAPQPTLYEYFGFTPENISDRAGAVLKGAGS